jgi:uncharacterized C2H2 Zn-finger protein
MFWLNIPLKASVGSISNKGPVILRTFYKSKTLIYSLYINKVHVYTLIHVKPLLNKYKKQRLEKFVELYQFTV